MPEQALASQVDYYRRRAGEYDAPAYGDVAATRARVDRFVAEMQPAGTVLEIARGTGMWTEALAASADTVTAMDVARDKETYLPDSDEIVERRLEDGSRYRIVNNFVDPEYLERRLREIGWDCRIRRDEGDWVWVWVCGEARPLA